MFQEYRKQLRTIFNNLAALVTTFMFTVNLSALDVVILDKL